MSEPFVVAGCPVRNRGWIVEDHADALTDQSTLPPPNRIFYLVNDCEEDDLTEDTLGQLVYEGRDWISFEVFNTGHPGWHRGSREDGWKTGPHPTYHEDNCANNARVRNRWIERALKLWPQATHLWSVDSDVLPKKDCLERLLAADKDIVAAVVRNGERAYNFMLDWIDFEPARTGHEADAVAGDAPFPVSLLGACVLIRREVLVREPLVRFAAHPRGEDFPFCEAARLAGYQLWVEPRARTEHWMGKDEVWR